MSDMVSTSFKLPEAMDKALPLLAHLHGLEGKSAYLRKLIQADLAIQLKKSDLFAQLNQLAELVGNTKDDPA